MTRIGWSYIIALAPIALGALVACITRDVVWLIGGMIAHLPAYEIARDLRQSYYDENGG